MFIFFKLGHKAGGQNSKTDFETQNKKIKIFFLKDIKVGIILQGVGGGNNWKKIYTPWMGGFF